MNSINENAKEPLLPLDDLEKFKNQLQLKTHQYGEFTFEDDKWYFQKLHRNSNVKERFTVHFTKYGTEYKEWYKYFTLIINDSVSVRKSKIHRINCFFNFFVENFPDLLPENINRKIINYYEQNLIKSDESEISSNEKSRRYSVIMEFFSKMNAFPGLPNFNPCKNKNPFKMTSDTDEEKYIPTIVVKQFDKVMKDERHQFPDSLRLAYWLQRSFPNRITEVTSINRNCLKPLYNMYIINIPTTKQSGGYIQEEIKTIPVMNSGHGKYIVELIKKVSKQTKESLEFFQVNEKDKDFLLLETTVFFKIENGVLHVSNPAKIQQTILELHNKFPDESPAQLKRRLEEMGVSATLSKIRQSLKSELDDRYATLIPYDGSRFNKYLNNIAKLCNITDENGGIYKIRSHQFRHNATTDRLYIGGYTMDQAMALRDDKGTTMPKHYVHQQKEMHKKMWMDTTGLQSPTEAPVEFKGRIMNLNDPMTLKRLTSDPRMYLTWEANSKKGVGLCSMISGCKPNGSSIHFECYECNWFVPKAEYYDDYKKELEYWNDIMIKSVGDPKRSATYENSIRNVNCLERIVQICENGIEKHKENMKQKIETGVLK
ncbi:integrase [Bacillus thuringiensis]|uniref:integrase n=1 Tax=Bacillus thuringiensis TaxID=1428 RepID=UPI0021D65F6B|nr:integrase [Bacillus thuringiensis]MCU7667759.1 integrase [Bacillus thuringiensis]